GLLALAGLLCAPSDAAAQFAKKGQAPAAKDKKAADKGMPAKAGPQTAGKPVAPHAPRSSQLTHEAWQNAPLTPVQPGEIDRLIAKELQQDKIDPAPLTTDEQFIRRATLDLTGQLPLPPHLPAFSADPDP